MPEILTQEITGSPRQYRWLAWRAIDGHGPDGDGPLGFGATKEEAVRELEAQEGNQGVTNE